MNRQETLGKWAETITVIESESWDVSEAKTELERVQLRIDLMEAAAISEQSGGSAETRKAAATLRMAGDPEWVSENEKRIALEDAIRKHSATAEAGRHLLKLFDSAVQFAGGVIDAITPTTPTVAPARDRMAAGGGIRKLGAMTPEEIAQAMQENQDTGRRRGQ